jgi:hypothetical protein
MGRNMGRIINQIGQVSVLTVFEKKSSMEKFSRPHKNFRQSRLWFMVMVMFTLRVFLL